MSGGTCFVHAQHRDGAHADALVVLRHRGAQSLGLGGSGVLGIVEVALGGAPSYPLFTVPHGAYVLSLQLAGPLHSHEVQGPEALFAALTGPRKTAVSYAVEGPVHTLAALLDGPCVSALLGGAPLPELVNARAALDHVLSPKVVRELREGVQLAPASLRVEALARWLTQGCGARRHEPAARRAWRASAWSASPTVRSRAELCAKLGCSPRTLDRDTRRWLGMAPAELLRAARLSRVLAALCAGQPAARVAAQEGFSDQAHLHHEVRRRTGRPPSAFRRAGLSVLGRAYLAATGRVVVG